MGPHVARLDGEVQHAQHAPQRRAPLHEARIGVGTRVCEAVGVRQYHRDRCARLSGEEAAAQRDEAPLRLGPALTGTQCVAAALVEYACVLPIAWQCLAIPTHVRGRCTCEPRSTNACVGGLAVQCNARREHIPRAPRRTIQLHPPQQRRHDTHSHKQRRPRHDDSPYVPALACLVGRLHTGALFGCCF